MIKGFNFKKGSIETFFMAILFIVMIISMSVIYILYIQINTYVYPIKQDIFYIVQNAYISLNKEKLSYYEYDINEFELNERITELMNLNHNNVNVEKIEYNENSNEVEIIVLVNFKPILLTNQIGNVKLKIKDTIKLKMMEVE